MHIYTEVRYVHNARLRFLTGFIYPLKQDNSNWTRRPAMSYADQTVLMAHRLKTAGTQRLGIKGKCEERIN